MTESKQKPKLIFLTGLMGAGKSTIGPLLAEELGREFIDLDQVIQTQHTLSVSEIFSQRGEQGFRRLESESLIEICKNHQGVVSLGGGTLNSSQSLDLIKQSGCLIYLKASVKTLAQRVYQEVQGRPLLSTTDSSALEDKLNELLEQRQAVYNQADQVIDTDTLTPQQVVEKIKEGLH